MRISTVFSARGLFALALTCAAVSPTAGQQPSLQPSQPQQREHTVRKGDTLWDLARYYLSDPYRWPLIYDANKKVVENPHWIFPTEKLIIPPVRDTLLGVPVDAAPTGPVSTRSRFYNPPSATDTTTTVVSSEGMSLRLVQPAEWIAAPWVADSASLMLNARVFKPYDPRDQHDKLDYFFHPRDRLYMANVGDGVKSGDRLLVIRMTKNLRGLGWLIEPQGIVQIDSAGPTTALGIIIKQFGNLKVGDLAIALPTAPAMPLDRLTEVSGGPVGEIVDFIVPQPLYGTTEYAIVDIGGARGLSIGDELLAYVAAQTVTDRRPAALPDQPIARMRVIRVTDATATVRVTRLNNSSLKAGLPVRVARKAP